MVIHASIAQLVEQLTCNQQVAGSIPVGCSIIMIVPQDPVRTVAKGVSAEAPLFYFIKKGGPYG